MDPREAEHLVDGRLVAPAVLADVERREVEPEGARADEEVGEQALPGERAVARLAQRPGEQLEVGDVRVGVVERLVGRDGGEPREHRVDLHAEGLVVEVAEVAVVDEAGESVEVGADRLQERARDVDAAGREAEVLAQRPELLGVQAHGLVAHHREGGAGDVGRHARVAVAVAADPRPVAQHGREVGGRLAVGLGEGEADVVVEDRDGAPDRAGEEVEAVVDLLEHAEALGADVVRAQEDEDEALERGPGVAGLARGRVRLAEGADVLHESALLAEHGASAGLGGVRRERGLDVEAGEELGRVPEGAPGVAQAAHGLGDGLEARRVGRDVAVALSVDAGDRELLGLIDEVEPKRQGAEEGADLRVREAREPFGGAVEPGAVRFGAGRGGVPRGFPREVRALALEDPVEQVGEQSDGLSVLSRHAGRSSGRKASTGGRRRAAGAPGSGLRRISWYDDALPKEARSWISHVVVRSPRVSSGVFGLRAGARALAGDHAGDGPAHAFSIRASDDLHHLLSARAVSGRPAPWPERLGGAAEAAAAYGAAMGRGPWVAMDLMVASGVAPEGLERAARGLAPPRRFAGDAGALRDAAGAYGAALGRALPWYESEAWPARRDRLAREARATDALIGDRALVARLASGLGMTPSERPVRVALAVEARRPGAWTVRGAGGEPVVFVGADVARGSASMLAEVTLHELTHAYDGPGIDSVPNRIRAGLGARGIGPRDEAMRRAWHTVFFVHAAETVRREIDPDHEDYGDGPSRVYERTAPESGGGPAGVGAAPRRRGRRGRGGGRDRRGRCRDPRGVTRPQAPFAIATIATIPPTIASPPRTARAIFQKLHGRSPRTSPVRALTRTRKTLSR